MSTFNTFCWVDLPVLDLDRAVKFYTAVLDKEVQKFQEASFEFGMFPHENNNVAGCLVLMPDRKPSKDGALVYVNVDGRFGSAIEATEQNGGKIVQEKMIMGPHGVRILVSDTEGNVVALWSSKE